MRREGVTQRMHAETRVLVDLLEEIADDLLNGAHGDTLAHPAEKDGVAVSLRTDRAQQLVALRFVISERENGVVAHGDDPFLSALAAYLHLLRHQVEIAAIHRL